MILFIGSVSCGQKATESQNQVNRQELSNDEYMELTNDEWKERLTEEQYRILRLSETERAFTGKYYKVDDDGNYRCAGCNNFLFSSDTKYDSGSGWPSFYQANEGSIKEVKDNSHGMTRIEIKCARCDGHLGHVFDDGPAPTGLRYCVNSAALDFEKKE